MGNCARSEIQPTAVPSSLVKFLSSTAKFPSSRLTDMYMLGCTEHPFDMTKTVLPKHLDL